MSRAITRRDALKRIAASGTGMMFAGVIQGRGTDIVVAGEPVEIAIWSLSRSTTRIAVRPLRSSALVPIPVTGALAQEDSGRPVSRGRNASAFTSVRSGDLVVSFTDGPPTIHVRTRSGEVVQQLFLDAARPGMSFPLGSGPLLGFGEGGSQFDRRGAVDDMRAGQGARSTGPGPFRLDTHGTRAPVQWLIGTAGGWAMFIHQPYGAFDLTGERGVFTPRADALPLDVFVVSSRDPAVIMAEYARITGLAEMPPRWAFGYMQSSRTLAGRGTWHDFWTEERTDGGREVDRSVDLATMPIYVRAGAVVPLGPVRQYTEEPNDSPTTLLIYPGADGTSTLYDDDGLSFNHRRGEFMKISMTWRDAPRQLSLRLVRGSRMLTPGSRRFEVRVAGTGVTTPVVFNGRSIDVQL